VAAGHVQLLLSEIPSVRPPRLAFTMPTDNNTQTLSQALPSSLTDYHEFVQQVLEALRQLGWEKDMLFGIHLALEEAISNAIRHGNKHDPEKNVQVDCEISPDRFWAKICDQGEGYSPDDVPDCCDDDNLCVPGGRGLKLIEAYMTAVELTEGGRCLTMEKHRAA
jgi:serine/threonine-protein kinase RsbW